MVGAIVASQLGLSSESRAAEPAAQSSDRSSSVNEPGMPMNTHLFRDIAKAVNPVVVYVTTESRVQSSNTDSFGNGPEGDFFRQFFGAPFGGQQQPRSQIERALGSGFIISKDGEILTNNHVVAGADKIQVELLSEQGKKYDAKVIGHDPLSDSALIKLENGPTNLPTAKLGDSKSLEPGDWVMAIGNPFNYGHTVTVGVVSFMGRPFREIPGRNINMIQTDASINPGNSGGPLVDTNGDVVGINTAILSGGEGEGNIGIGFAVPIDTVKNLLPQLRKGQVVRGYLGVTMLDVTEDEVKGLGLPSTEGVLVRQVEQDSPAERAGVMPGDVIVKFNGTEVKNSDQISQLVAATQPGTTVKIEVYRNARPQTLTATITQLHLDEQGNEKSNGGQTHYGLSLGDVTPNMARRLGLQAGTDGALVQQVQQGSPAEGAGLQPGDVILEVNRHRVHSAQDAANELQSASGGTVFLLVSRHGQQLFISMKGE
jgi:serine protease Do